MRFIESDDNLTLRGAALDEAIKDDIKLGLIPFWVCNAYYVYVKTTIQTRVGSRYNPFGWTASAIATTQVYHPE